MFCLSVIIYLFPVIIQVCPKLLFGTQIFSSVWTEIIFILIPYLMAVFLALKSCQTTLHYTYFKIKF